MISLTAVDYHFRDFFFDMSVVVGEEGGVEGQAGVLLEWHVDTGFQTELDV